jgi:hypothetical protein
MTKDPSPRFLRFARALALASGVAPFGCGGNTGLRVSANDARPGQAETGSIHGDVGVDGASHDLGSPDDVVIVGPPGYPGGIMGVPVAPYDGGSLGLIAPPPHDAGPQDLGVVIGYDGGFFGLRPYPAPDAAIDVRTDAEGDVVALDAAIERIPVGGPQAAPALPADWLGAARA